MNTMPQKFQASGGKKKKKLTHQDELRQHTYNVKYVACFYHPLFQFSLRKSLFIAVVISKNFSKGALCTTTPIVRVWPSYNHAHVFKDENMIMYFDTDIV